ncbi:VanZ like protein [Herbihabitans rhizosphaerae]|uniref:VanZ like protein n=1 Tax=Herbihabitans rhizosphaerae TaxID=1872711 RepID=A0A4Q7KNM1_9PSEU|nr:VanZ family protein [Herbihabitans rhizosphaerae]RZS37907.1 VanZ like protein [Herbihabitans rhizosphaerae]
MGLLTVTDVERDINLAERIFEQPGVLAAGIGGCLVLGALGVLLGRAFRWRPVFAGLAGFSLGGALTVTLARVSTSKRTGGLDACLHNDFSLSSSYARLNFVMLMPFAFFAVLAVRRFLPVALAAVVLGFGIEAVQVATGRGVCEMQDMLNNALGGVIAAVVAWALNVLVSRGLDQRPSEVDTRRVRA